MRASPVPSAEPIFDPDRVFTIRDGFNVAKDEPEDETNIWA